MAHVPHLYVPGPWEAPLLDLDEVGSNHIRKVLRRVDGDPVTYTDGTGHHGRGHLSSACIVRGEEAVTVRPIRPVLAVAPPAQRDRARFLVEKLAELGTLDLRWLETTFGEGRPPPADKVALWCRSALEQSGSSWMMSVAPGTSTIGDLPDGTVFADQSGLTRDDLGDVACIAIGPEGGWAPGEVPADAPLACLGRSVLRVETAAIAAAAIANF
ncbi:MAG TPA: 16S rRNA (uracil(1498)-N(3))-methyltransferase [Acidimicrobiia bacterium]|nr:16S rRNA (uracil(1498)-N(3))-methyltransferase [Acidimicrobiia bacterium]